MHEVFNLTYHNEEIHRLLVIYRRTTNNRIKDKLFKRIFGLCLEEKGIIILEDVVIMKYDIYKYLKSCEKAVGRITDKSGEVATMELKEIGDVS